MMNPKGKFICSICRSLHVEVFREMGSTRDYTTYICNICNNINSAVDGEPGSTFIERKKCDFQAIKITKNEYLEIIKIEENKNIISKINNDHEILFIYTNIQKCWYILLNNTVQNFIYLPSELYNQEHTIVEELDYLNSGNIETSTNPILFGDVIGFFKQKKSDSSLNYRISQLLIEKLRTDFSND